MFAMVFNGLTAKEFFKLASFLTFFVLVTLLVFEIAIVPKTPATMEQVIEVLVSQGYQPQDTTELYNTPNSNLIKSIDVQKDDVRFEFFCF